MGLRDKVLFFLFYILFLQNGGFSQEKYRLKYVEIIGAEKISVNTIMDISSLKKGKEMRKAEIMRNIGKIEPFYRSEGFLDVRVIDYKIVSLEKNEVALYIYISEGEKKLVFAFNVVLHPERSVFLLKSGKEDSLMLKKIFSLTPSVPFYYNEKFLLKFEEKVWNEFLNHGYPFFDMTREVKRQGADSVKIVYFLLPGPKFKVNTIEIEGMNKTTRRRIAEREITLKEGEFFHLNKILSSIGNLYSTGLFSSITYKIVPLTKDSTSGSIVFNLKEKKPKRLRMGAGYSTEQDFQIRTGFDHLNVFNNGQKLNIETKFNINLAYIRHIETDLSYKEPFLFKVKLLGQISPFFYFDRDENIRRFGIDFQVTKSLEKIRGLQLSSRLNLQKVLERGSPTNPSLYLNSIIFSPTYDIRDNILDPRRGIFTMFQIEQSGWILGGDTDLRRYLFDISLFIPYFSYTFAGRFRTGGIFPYGRTDEVPVSEKFLMGGEGSVRGVKRYSIGEPDERLNIPASGNFFINTNFEIRKYIFSNKIHIILFLDSGNLKNKFSNVFSLSSFENTIGAGIRYFLFFVPLRFDYGFPVKNFQWDKGYFYFGIGHMF